mgnify:CR=1 FL=1
MDSAPTAENSSATPDHPLRLAASDVGTNSIRLLIAEQDEEGGYRVLDEEKVTPRLGHGMADTGMIAPDRLESAIDAVERMKQISLGYGVAEIRVIATSAVREASNGDEFVRGVKRTSNLSVQVIGHDDEGRLAHTSVAAAFDVKEFSFAVADIGGGSTEVVLSEGGAVEKVVGLKLGAVRVADMFGGKGVTDADAFDEMRQFLKTEIEAAVEGITVKPTVLFGTGGTYAALASIQLAKEGQAFDSVQGQRLTRDQVTRTLKDLRSSLSKGNGVAGLNKDRQDIIVPGAAIVESLMKTLKIDELVVHDRGIRDGLMLTMMEAHAPGTNANVSTANGPASSATSTRSSGSRSEAVRRFARQCRYHEAHSEHVTRLSLDIFDQLATLLPELSETLARTSPTHPLVLDADAAMDEEGRNVLEAAGVLHDIGYLVNHSKHHKHSYYIIANGDLDGFTPRERELIANVARYHRRSHPKSSHEAYRALDPHDRKIVRRLSAVLRVADGLDRTHTQVVQRVTVAIEARDGADHPNTVVFRIDAPDDVSTDIWGAQRKAELFALAFGLRCAFEVG